MSELQDIGSLEDCYVRIANGKKALAVSGGGVPLSVSIATIPGGVIKVPVDQFFVIDNGETTLAAAAPAGTRTFTVTNPAIFSIGDVINVISATLYAGKILSVSGNDIGVDTLIPVDFPSGSIALSRSRDMNVDGSVTPVHFKIEIPENLFNGRLNIASLTQECLTADAVSLSNFGDIVGGLTYPCFLRVVPPSTSGISPANSWSVRENSEFGRIGGPNSWQPFAATNPVFGQDGFLWQYSYGGQCNHDIIIPLRADARIEYVIQDDLTTLEKYTMLFRGNSEVDIV